MDTNISMLGYLAKERMDLGEFDVALSIYKNMVENLKNNIKDDPSLENYILLAKTLSSCGDACENLDELEDSLDYYLESSIYYEKATQMVDSLQLLEKISSTRETAGLLYKELDYDDDFIKEFEKSNKIIRKMIKMDENPHNLFLLADNLTTLGLYFEDELDFKEAEKYYKQAFDLDVKLYELEPCNKTMENLSYMSRRYCIILGLVGKIDESIRIANLSAEILEN